MTPSTIKRDATGPTFRATLVDAEGEPIDLTGATVAFRMRNERTQRIKVDAAATVTDSTAGRVAYSWLAADTDEAGIFSAEVVVTFADGRIEVFPSDGFHRVEVVSGAR